MVIKQGDVFWLDLGEPVGSEPGYRRPFVVIQNDAFNKSKIGTVVACAITTNMKLASAPGNVQLNKGEGNLPKPSVVNVSQVLTVDKEDVKEKIGQLSKTRVEEIVAGFGYLIKPRVT